MNRRPPPAVPHPELLRQPREPYGWMEVRLLTEQRLRELGPQATATLVFLALVADRRGASWWSRAKMADSLAMSLADVDRALDRLLEQHLLAHRPWKHGHRDGVWQLLPLPGPEPPSPRGGLRSLGSLLNELGEKATRCSRSPPESRAY